MTEKDMMKLTDAGYCLIKVRYDKRKLREKSHVIMTRRKDDDDWCDFANFKKKVDAKEFYDKLLENPNTIAPYAFN